MSTPLDRITKAIDYLKDNGIVHKQQDIVDTLAMNKGNLSRALHGNPRYLTLFFLKRFYTAYSDYINEDWLLSGVGEMIKLDPKAFRPHIPADVAMVGASPLGVTLARVLQPDCEVRPIMTPFKWYDFTITVTGNSMYPVIFDGDTIACLWMERGDSFKPECIYVLDTAEGAVVKRVEPQPDGLLCRSENPDYPPFTVDGAAILRAARVVGIIRNL